MAVRLPAPRSGVAADRAGGGRRVVALPRLEAEPRYHYDPARDVVRYDDGYDHETGRQIVETVPWAEFLHRQAADRTQQFLHREWPPEEWSKVHPKVVSYGGPVDDGPPTIQFELGYFVDDEDCVHSAPTVDVETVAERAPDRVESTLVVEDQEGTVTFDVTVRERVRVGGAL